MDVYAKDHLPQPVDEMRRFRKTGVTPMWFVRGPFVVETQEGSYTLPEGWEGYVAVDRAGYPYPIEKSEHEQTYEEVFE
jgi:hypothetical protein